MGNKIASQYKYKTLYHKYDTIYAKCPYLRQTPKNWSKKFGIKNFNHES
jgi:hypothetical protein